MRTSCKSSLYTVLAALLLAGQAAAQPYPSKPIRIVVPFGPGGSGDITARTFGQYLEAQTRQPVIIENKPGANGIIGTETVKIAPADGYTLLLTTNTTHAANVSLYRKVPYDPLKDFEHIGLFGTFGSVAVVPQGSAIQSIPDLVAFARANPGRVFFGHYNSASQMSAELFKLRAGVEMTAVSYKAIGNAVADLMGRQIQVLYPGYELTAFLGLAAPARTPLDVVDALHGLLLRALADPGVTQSFDRLGMATRAMGRDEYRRYVAQEIERWREHVRAAGIEPQ